jgi:hypothetical protein
VETMGRGLFRLSDAPPGDLTVIEAVARAPRATLPLTTSRATHDLSDAIPAAVDLALPRGTRFPQVAGQVSWHAFDPARFDLGREVCEVEDGCAMGVYNAERTLVDTFRMRHIRGDDETYEALRRWLRHPGAQPSTLLTMAGHFPRSLPPIRHALTILL